VVGVEHHLVLGDVGDGEDPVVIAAERVALETHAGLERPGKAAARLDSQQILVVLAESVLRLKPYFDAVLDSLALEGGLDRREDPAVAAVQILHRLIGTLDQVAPEIGELDRERNDRVPGDPQRGCY